MKDQSAKQDLINAIVRFLSNVVIGTEKALYRAFIDQKMDLSILKTPEVLNVLKSLLPNYFNAAYRALIYSTNGVHKREVDKDDYFYDTLSKIAAYNDHSYICILNIMIALSQSIMDSFDRSTVDLSGLDAYAQCIRNSFYRYVEENTQSILTLFDHNCTGIDIRTCDPAQDMFEIHSTIQST